MNATTAMSTLTTSDAAAATEMATTTAEMTTTTTTIQGPHPHFFPSPPVCSESSFLGVTRATVIMTLVLVVVSNTLMLMVTWKAASTRINPYFFVSLAMSDLLTGLFVLPFDLTFILQAEFSTGSATPDAGMCTFSGVFFHILQTVSLFSFFALSLDRLLTITYPLNYPLAATPKVNLLCVAAIWLIPSAMYGMLPIAGLGAYGYKCWQAMCNITLVDMNYLTFLMLTCVAVFVATYAINGRIFYIAHKQRSRIVTLELSVQQNTGHNAKIGSSLKAAKSIVMALGLFTLCWGPYYCLLFLLVLFGVSSYTPATEFIALWIAISNSFMNFFVFLATYRSFRSTFKKMMGLRRGSVGAAGMSMNTGSS